MNLDLVPIWVVFIGTVLLVMVFIEVGYRLGGIAHRKSVDEKETPVSGVSATVLGLTAFILAFSFSIVTQRYDTRKALVRDEADAIRTAYLRAGFLPDPDRGESRRLLLDVRSGTIARRPRGPPGSGGARSGARKFARRFIVACGTSQS